MAKRWKDKGAFDNYTSEVGKMPRSKPTPTPPPPLARRVEARDAQREWERREALREAILHAVNCNSIENETNTPDWILADYLIRCLYVFETTVKARALSALPDIKPAPKGGSK